MDEMRRHGKVGLAGLRAGMSRNTASKYVGVGRLPSELREARDWRTREDPFAEDWPEIRGRLAEAPELEAKALFEDLVRRKPERYEPGQLRTLQRRVKRWRAQEGPPKVVFFPQQHRPGEAMQTDFTWGTELEVAIAGEPFAHLLCHPVLPYSNWEWVTVCRSESMSALRRGVQGALFQLGRVPEYHQTDNSTAATHDLRTGKRGFNAEYEALVRHYGMTPRTIEVGEKHQNGDVESLHGALKRRLKQHLLLRGSRDFPTVQEYEQWLQSKVEAANRLRRRRLEHELEGMRPLPESRLPEFREEDVPVSSGSTIRVQHNTYSVPSRLKEEWVRVRVYDERLEVYYANEHQVTLDRLPGRNGHAVNYRHIVTSLVQKPGAFARYRYREDLFPTLAFRRAYDALSEGWPSHKADLEYVRVLHLAASTMESEVEQALELLLEAGTRPTSEQVRALVAPKRPEIPDLGVGQVDLAEYDHLLEQPAEVAL
jgi:hypothetical protein